jgi:phage gp29-like protein
MADNRPSLLEITGIKNGRDVTRGWVGAIGNYLPTQDSLLLLKSGGDLRLYEQVAQDDQVKACLQQRFRAVTAHEWEVLPGGDKRIDKAAAKHLEDQLKAIKWDDITEKMLWGVFYGFSASEVIWKQDDSKIVIDNILVRNRRRFHFNQDQQLVLKTFQSPLGEQLPDKKFWYFTVGADHDDEPYGRGLAHWLYWPAFFKRNGVRWWLRFLELFASPARKGTYPSGATNAEKDVLWEALANFGQDDRMMIPEGLDIEFLESARNGSVDYKAMCDQMDAAISKVLLSQTMTTDNGSSQSQAEVHQDVADSVIESDADLVCDSFNSTVVRWLTDWNFPGAAYPKVWRKLESEPDLDALADCDTKLQGLGISLKPEAIVGKYGDDYLIPENKEQIPQLNGEQVNALVSIVSNAKQANWSPELVAGMINGAFPNWPEDAVAAITKNLGDPTPIAGQVPGEPPAPNPQAQQPADRSLDDVAAQFADEDIEGTYEFKMKEGTTKIKNGVTYVLTNSRWKLAQPKPKAASRKKALSDKSVAVVVDVKDKSGVVAKAKKTKPDPKADIKLNQANLDKHVAEIEKQAGGADITSLNKNIGDILNSEDTGVFVRVGSSHVLNQILGGGFKNSVELGIGASVPGLKGSYLDARKRVESEQLGYAVDHDPTKRPIYAYAGNANDLNSSSHKDVASFGEITVKLRNETKDRSSFTGADSFKSGVASSMKDPSVGSMIQSHKHGKKTGISNVQSQLDKIGKAKNIDDLVKASTGDGNRYTEVQVHGGVKPSDIGEIHYKSNGEPPIPDQRIRDWAKANDVNIYQNGKLYEHREVSPQRRAEIAKTVTKDDYEAYINSPG